MTVLKKILSGIFTYFVIIFTILVSVFPILWVIMSSFKTNGEILGSPFSCRRASVLTPISICLWSMTFDLLSSTLFWFP